MKSAVVLCICKILLMQSFSVLVQQSSGLFFTEPINYKFPCSNTTDVVMGCEPGLFSEKINKFFVKINRTFTTNCTVKVMFDSDIVIRFSSDTHHSGWETMVVRAGDTMEKRFSKPQNGFIFLLMGTTSEHPNLKSLSINDMEYCKEPTKGLFNKCVKEVEYSPEDKNKAKAVTRKHDEPNFQCGRHRIRRNMVTDPISGIGFPEDTGSVVDGVSNTEDWPWHVAVFILPIIMYIADSSTGTFIEPYISGGTLISRNFVLTARHDAWLHKDNSNPEFYLFFVALGRNNIDGSANDQDRVKVVRSITPVSKTNSLDYGIALLKLQFEVQFTNNIRPACLWHRREYELRKENTVGVLTGWGTTNDDQFTQPLQQVNLPIVSRDICIKKMPTYEEYLTDKDFCAGFLNNGTAPCFGDIGGALQVFIPDKATGDMSGSWYVRGVMTRSIYKDRAICDENTYAIFADEELFADWIDSNLDG